MVGDQSFSLAQTRCNQNGGERRPLAATIKLTPHASDLEARADQRMREEGQDQGTAPYAELTEP